MNLWHLNNVKVILLNCAKDYSFWTLWTLSYGDFIPFFYIDFFHLGYNQAK